MSAIKPPSALAQSQSFDWAFSAPLSLIELGKTTTVTTCMDHAFDAGHHVKLTVPSMCGCTELNNVEGIILDVTQDNKIIINIDSSKATPFLRRKPPICAILYRLE